MQKPANYQLECLEEPAGQELRQLVVCNLDAREFLASTQELKQQWHELQDVHSPLKELTKALTEHRLKKQQVRELHLIAHGSSQGIQLNGQWIDVSSLLSHAAELAQWQIDRLVLWCCHIGQNQAFIAILEELTGAQVFASGKVINKNNQKVVSRNGEARELKDLIEADKLLAWQGELAAPYLRNKATNYETVTFTHSNVLAGHSSVTITGQTIIRDGSIQLTDIASTYVVAKSSGTGPNGFGVGIDGSRFATGNWQEIGHHGGAGLTEKLVLEFNQVIPKVNLTTGWLHPIEGTGIYKMYRDNTLITTGTFNGLTDNVDLIGDLTTGDGYGFDKLEFTADLNESNDYLVNKLVYEVPSDNDGWTAQVDELDDASSQDIAAQTGSFTVLDADNAGTLTASTTGDPTITLNGTAFTLPSGASALTASGALTLSPASQNWDGSWDDLTWTYDPDAADLDFIPDGQDLVITYGVQLSDGTNTSNTANIKITISGENDAPSISDATYTLDEDTASGTIFHDTDDDSTSNDTDVESETITYSITAGNPDGIFAIDTNTGEISIAAGQSLNYDTATQHILTVEATDSAETNTADVTINVLEEVQTESSEETTTSTTQSSSTESENTTELLLEIPEEEEFSAAPVLTPLIAGEPIPGTEITPLFQTETIDPEIDPYLLPRSNDGVGSGLNLFGVFLSILIDPAESMRAFLEGMVNFQADNDGGDADIADEAAEPEEQPTQAQQPANPAIQNTANAPLIKFPTRAESDDFLLRPEASSQIAWGLNSSTPSFLDSFTAQLNSSATQPTNLIDIPSSIGAGVIPSQEPSFNSGF